MPDVRRTAAAFACVVALAADLEASIRVAELAVTTADGKTTRVEITYVVHGAKLRVERVRPDEPGRAGLIHIYDADAARLLVLDVGKREAEIIDAIKAAREVEERLPSASISAAVTPTGRTKELLGVRCREYTFLITAPLTGSAKVVRRGTAWMSAEGAGAGEYVAFFRDAATVLTAGSVLAPGSVIAADRTDTEFYRQMALVGGIPYAFEMRLEVDGGGLTARMLRGALTWTRVATTTVVDAVPASPGDFEIPAGWKTRVR